MFKNFDNYLLTVQLLELRHEEICNATLLSVFLTLRHLFISLLD